MDFDVIAFVGIIRNQFRDGPCFFPNDPGRGKGNHPAGFRVTDLDAIQEGICTPAPFIVLDPPFAHLPVHFLVNLLLGLSHLLHHLGTAANDVEGCPGEERGNGAEIGTVSVAADPRSLKGNRAGATEGISHLRPMPETQFPQLLHQLGQAGGMGAQVCIDFIP